MPIAPISTRRWKPLPKASQIWRAVAPFDRCKIMRKAAAIMRERNDEIGPLLTLEQGKTLAEAKMEAMAAADIIEWFAEEAKRAYGRVIPARGPGIYQIAIKEPVGPVAAFTPWNFPINQVVRKISAGPGRWLFDHRQGAGGNPGVTSAIDPRLCRRRRARWRDQSGLRRTGGNFGISHSAPRHPQDFLHGLDPCRQAAFAHWPACT